MAEEKELLAGFLRELSKEFAQGNAFALRELGNKAIEEAALQNSKPIASVALIAYCLHKLHSKQHIARHKKWIVIRKQILVSLGKAIDALQRQDSAAFDRSMKRVVESVQSIDRQLGNYVQDLFEKAKVKYASSAYSLGLGLSQSAELTGANKRELLHYIGSTKISDRDAVIFGIKERLRRLMAELEKGEE